MRTCSMAASMGCTPDVDTGLPDGPFDNVPAPAAGNLAMIRIPRTRHRAVHITMDAQTMHDHTW